MTKISPAPTATTELMTPGQTSEALLAKLKQLGASLSDQQIGECYARVEGQRRRFMADVVRLGVMLLAKKEAAGHGKWAPWVSAMTKSADSALLTLPPVVQEKSLRSCQVYMQVGKHFLADLEQGGFAPEAGVKAAAPACSALEVALLPDLPKARQTEVERAVDQFIDGRSLDRMLIDFRRAESAADQEAIAEAKKKRGKKKDDPRQLDFYDDMQRPLTDIENLMTSRDVLETADKAYWLQLATALEGHAKRARQLAKEAGK